MSGSKSFAVSWSNLPDILIKQSSILQEYISSDAYLDDQDRIQFQILVLEINGFKDDLHSGVPYIKFIDSEENRDILARYLQNQLDQITNLRNDFKAFLTSNQIVSSIPPKLLRTPTMSPEKPEEDSQDMSQIQPDGLYLNHKKAFLDSISFFIAKLKYQRDNYKNLYSQRDNVSKFLSCLVSAKQQLPATTYTLERLCENVRTNLQDFRSLIQGVNLGEKQYSRQESLNLFKRRYNKIKTLPIIQYFAKLFKVVRELKTSSFQFSRAIAIFQLHLKDKENMSSAQELIDRIEQEAVVRGKLRRQSDPTVELTPKKQISSHSKLRTLAAQTLPKNQTTLEQMQFELDSEMTNDRASRDEDSLIPMNIVRSRTQSSCHSVIKELDEEASSNQTGKNNNPFYKHSAYEAQSGQIHFRQRSQSNAACEESIKAMNPKDNSDYNLLNNMKQQQNFQQFSNNTNSHTNHQHHQQQHHAQHQLQHRHLTDNNSNTNSNTAVVSENQNDMKNRSTSTNQISTVKPEDLRYTQSLSSREMAIASNKSSQLSASGFMDGETPMDKTYYSHPNKGGCEGKCMVCTIF